MFKNKELYTNTSHLILQGQWQGTNDPAACHLPYHPEVPYFSGMQQLKRSVLAKRFPKLRKPGVIKIPETKGFKIPPSKEMQAFLPAQPLR